VAQSLVYGVDVGTTKVVAIAGRLDGRRGIVEVVAAGEAPSRGLRRGVVVDRKAAADSIAEAVRECGLIQGKTVSVGIAGSHISSYNTDVTLLNRGRDLTVTERFVRRLEQEARQIDLTEDEHVIHVVPRGYVLDGSEGVRQPVGMAARKVTMRAHVVSGAVSSIQNLLRAVEDCGVRVGRVVLEPLASAEACLRETERENGVALLDIGGGTTDIAAFIRGALTHTAVIPIGGEAFTSDVSYGLKVPHEAAERLKLEYGNVLPATVDSVAAVRGDDRHYNAHFLSQILEYRARELLEYARDSLTQARVQNLIPEGVMITGGGSLMDGIDELAEEVLGLRARTSSPGRMRGNLKAVNKPQYSTAVGLLYFSTRTGYRGSESKGATASSFGSIVSAVKSWFRGG
jgi:cell division protein FtsA